jgi:hypothetical protein
MVAMTAPDYSLARFELVYAHVKNHATIVESEFGLTANPLLGFCIGRPPAA